VGPVDVSPSDTKASDSDRGRLSASARFSIQISRNLVVQAFGLGMVSLMGLGVAPWPLVLTWVLATVATVVAESLCLRLVAKGGGGSEKARAWAPLLRFLTTTLYALAALALIARGGWGERLFAFALVSASMVNVLMRYYRSPRVLLVSLSPYVLVLALSGFGATRTALRQDDLLGALAPAFAIVMFAVQFWSARAQLSAAWVELMDAREAAEARERAADQANRTKSQFLANMSHELRTPLNGVLGMAQALMADPLTATQRERVGVIRRSSQSLLSALNDLLDLSKLEASILELEVAEFDLEHLVRGVVAAHRSLAKVKGLSFAFEVADAARGRYLGDSARIRRILHALADNAVKFTPSGGVTLRVGRDAEQLVFRVVDTGIGIDQEELTRLFDGFFQADATLSRHYGGAGIGLTICSQLTSLMGGSIAAESQLGAGAAFILSLPLPRAAVPAAVEAQPAETERAGELRVLAAEDNVTNQLVLKTLLAPVGIAPTLVVNGREALDAWERQTWDIVLMDIQMPEMNGIDATRAIRRREQETGRCRTPIVAVTANAMTHQVTEYVAAGMDGVVAKPVDVANLFNAIELALARRDRSTPQANGAIRA
jgi:signal transduction histidine kinase/ActR/RegA family two-component response regulator